MPNQESSLQIGLLVDKSDLVLDNIQKFVKVVGTVFVLMKLIHGL